LAVSFVNGGNWSTWRKPPTYDKSLTYLITMLYQVHLVKVGFKITMLVGIGTDCIGSCKSNYHIIRTMMFPAAIPMGRRYIGKT